MRKIILLATLFIWVIPYTAYSQDQVGSRYKRNTVYAELGGNSVEYGIGYDRIFGEPNDLIKFSLTLGAGSILGSSVDIFQTSQINCLIGRNWHNLEIGLGLISHGVWIRDGNIKFTDGFVEFSRIGYRYQRLDGGVFVRTGVTFYSYSGLDMLVPSGGVALGWSF